MMKRIINNMSWLLNMPKTGNDVLDNAIDSAFTEVSYKADNEEYNLLNALRLLQSEEEGVFISGKCHSQKIFVDNDIVELIERALSNQLIDLDDKYMLSLSSNGASVIDSGVVQRRLSSVTYENEIKKSAYIKEFLNKIKNKLIDSGNWNNLNKYEIYPILYDVIAGMGIIAKDETKNNKDKYDMIRNYYR